MDKLEPPQIDLDRGSYREFSRFLFADPKELWLFAAILGALGAGCAWAAVSRGEIWIALLAVALGAMAGICICGAMVERDLREMGITRGGQSRP